MGCTSSAPNMADVHTNATEDTQVNMNIETDQTAKNTPKDDVKMEVQSNIKALPSCDNFNENIQLASQNRSTEIKHGVEFTVRDMNHDVPLKNEVQENNITTDDKITTFKEVADIIIVNKILEDTRAEEIKELPNKDESVNETMAINESENINTEQCYPEIITTPTEEIQITEEENHGDEHESPTQSESSRATRWEALADLAAELPPSLAVDPVTGQIYTLSK